MSDASERAATRAGARAVLAIAASALALYVGLRTVFAQADNFELAAELDGLQREAEWNARRATALRARVEQLTFDAEVEAARGARLGEGERAQR